MTAYPMTASACFEIVGTGQDVTIEGVPFDWNPAAGDRDMQAARAVATWFGENERADVSLILIWVSTGPRKVAA